MGINIDNNNGNCTVLVEDNMTIYEAVEQKTVLLNALNELGEDEQMEIDLSNVNEMDTSGVQILLLVKQEAEKSRKVVLLVAHSPASLDVIDRYNLAAYFGDPVMLSSSGH